MTCKQNLNNWHCVIHFDVLQVEEYALVINILVSKFKISNKKIKKQALKTINLNEMIAN